MANVIPIAEKMRTNYENLVAICPSCGHECIFNRASDLCTFDPIGELNVSCLDKGCRKPFRLVGDSVNEPHEMLIYDCYEFLERKHYMNCILSVAQAYEVFFSLALRAELLYKPFAAAPNQGLAELDRLSMKLGEKIRKRSFSHMQALFLRQITARHSPANLDEASAIIDALSAHPGVPKDSTIEALSDTKLVQLLKGLKATTVHSLRNNVVHKHAYRPTRDQIETALKEARSILFPLSSHLGLHDDVNWYMAPS